MKRVFTGILTAALAVLLCAATAFAAGPRCGRYYVDADGDGICDNYGTGLGLGRGCGHGHGSRCGRGW